MCSNYTRDILPSILKEKYSSYGSSPNCEIGEYTYGIPEIFWYGENTHLKIGKFCSIAKGTQIFLGGEHRGDFVSTYPFACYAFEWEGVKTLDQLEIKPSKGDVVIGNDVWIGSGATILSGVTIGDGAIIGARSLITKDVPPYAVFGGNPAIHLKNRFSDEEIKGLLNVKWWDWPKSKIDACVALILSRNIDEFLRYCDA